MYLGHRSKVLKQVSFLQQMLDLCWSKRFKKNNSLSFDVLSVQDGSVFKGTRLVIPPSIREEFKQKVHQSH